jgi:hypothetical protein
MNWPVWWGKRSRPNLRHYLGIRLGMDWIKPRRVGCSPGKICKPRISWKRIAKPYGCGLCRLVSKHTQIHEYISTWILNCRDRVKHIYVCGCLETKLSSSYYTQCLAVQTRESRPSVHSLQLRGKGTSDVRIRVSACEICGQRGSGTGFSPTFSVFSCQYHSTVSLRSPT